MPNDQWDDFALSQQFESIDRRFEAQEKRLDTHDHTFEGLSHFPVDVAKAALSIDHLTEELREFRTEYRSDKSGRHRDRLALIVAIVAGSLGIVASTVAALITLLGGS